MSICHLKSLCVIFLCNSCSPFFKGQFCWRGSVSFLTYKCGPRVRYLIRHSVGDVNERSSVLFHLAITASDKISCKKLFLSLFSFPSSLLSFFPSFLSLSLVPLFFIHLSFFPQLLVPNFFRSEVSFNSRSKLSHYEKLKFKIKEMMRCKFPLSFQSPCWSFGVLTSSSGRVLNGAFPSVFSMGPSFHPHIKLH